MCVKVEIIKEKQEFSPPSKKPSPPQKKSKNAEGKLDYLQMDFILYS